MAGQTKHKRLGEVILGGAPVNAYDRVFEWQSGKFIYFNTDSNKKEFFVQREINNFLTIKSFPEAKIEINLLSGEVVTINGKLGASLKNLYLEKDGVKIAEQKNDSGSESSFTLTYHNNSINDITINLRSDGFYKLQSVVFGFLDVYETIKLLPETGEYGKPHKIVIENEGKTFNLTEYQKLSENLKNQRVQVDLDLSNTTIMSENSSLVEGKGANSDNSIFMNCASLRRVVMPKGIKEIFCPMFQGCISLEEIIFQEGLVRVGSPFGNRTALGWFGTSQALGLFAYCAVDSITLPASVRTIDNGFLSLSQIKELHLKAKHLKDIKFTNVEGGLFGGDPSHWAANPLFPLTIYAPKTFVNEATKQPQMWPPFVSFVAE